MIRTWQKAIVYGLLLVYAAVTLVPAVYLVAASLKEVEDLDEYTFFPPPGQLTLVNFAKLFGSSRLALAEVRDPAGLCAALARDGAGETPSPARQVWALLEEPERALAQRIAAEHAAWEALCRATDKPPPPPAVTRADRETLRGALDRLLGRRDFHAEADFADVGLGWEARVLLERGPETLSGGDLARLNRLLLEAAWPGPIAQNQVRIPFGRYIVNSLFVAGSVVLVQVLFSSLGGFTLAKYQFRGKGLMTVVMLATMMIPLPVLLAPLYEQIFRLGLMDSHLGLIVPGAVSVFGLFLFRQSMLLVPDELMEAARLDGCSEFGIYWTVAVPLSRPMIGAFTLIAFMANWNSFLWPQVILHTKGLFTLPIGMAQLVGTQEQIVGPLMAGTLLGVLPAMLMFLLFQREFISGLTEGAVKG